MLMRRPFKKVVNLSHYVFRGASQSSKAASGGIQKYFLLWCVQSCYEADI